MLLICPHRFTNFSQVACIKFTHIKVPLNIGTEKNYYFLNIQKKKNRFIEMNLTVNVADFKFLSK